MNKLMAGLVAAILVVTIWPGSARAANSIRQGAIGLNVDVNNDFVIAGKYFASKDIAVLAGFGLGIKGADAKGVDVGITFGARKYLRVDDFAPFVGGTFFYTSTHDGDIKEFGGLAEAGAEYFLHKQFSIEGKIGFGYTSKDTIITSTASQGNAVVTTTAIEREATFGTVRSGISFNFYF